MATYTYCIGNSLTLDGRPMLLGSRSGNTPGYHVTSGASLKYIANHPADTTFSLLGDWLTAFTNYTFNDIVVQPYVGSTIEDELAAVAAFRARASGSPAWFLFRGWPQGEGGANYQLEWGEPSSVVDGAPVAMTAAFLNNFFERASIVVSTERWKQIPVGDLLYRLDVDFRAGGLAGFSTVADIFRDPYHLTNYGRLGAAMLLWLFVFDGMPPDFRSQLTPSFDGDVTITDALLSYMKCKCLAVYRDGPANKWR